MYPQTHEIEQVGDAFIVIGTPTPEYSPTQKEYLTKILSNYAQTLNTEESQKFFKDQIQISDALKILNRFATQYQNEKPIFDEFKEEIEDLLVTLNGRTSQINI